MLPTQNLNTTSRHPRGLSVDVGHTALRSVYVPPAALSETAFCDWIANALVGESIQYHEGLLFIDRSATTSTLTTQQRNRLHATARRAWIACELGLIHLFSQKVSDGHYRYIAVRACCGLTPRDIRSRLRNADANPTPQRPNSIQEQ
jgi:hypothetical protein